MSCPYRLGTGRLRWALQRQLTELHLDLTRRCQDLRREYATLTRDYATAEFQVEEIEETLRRLEGRHGS